MFTHFSVAFCNLQTRDEFSDLTKDLEKVVGQIRNCDSKLHQVTHRLDILNQRPRYELCLDQVSVSPSSYSYDIVAVRSTESHKLHVNSQLLPLWIYDGFNPLLLFLLLQPYFNLTLEKHDLTKMAAGLRPILKRSQ